MTGGYTGKIGFINLSTGEVQTEQLNEKLAREFIGAHGLGARVMFERQKGGIDPLGPDNILGFVTGPLTGTPVPTGSRYVVVCKSPLTGGWGDANSGGFFGPELKFAGWDAIFVSGIAPKPSYLMVTNESIEIRNAAQFWGKDTIETEDALIEQVGDPKLRIACIGPASEKLSLISGVCNDKGRYAARSGVGAVMGSKKLKAVAVRGKGNVSVADRETVRKLSREFTHKIKDVGFIQTLMKYGTCGNTAALVCSGASPVKNWKLTGIDSFPTVEKIDGDNVIAYEIKKYGCFSCPIRCGGIMTVSTGKHPVAKTHKPEYETVAAFGGMCLNDDLHSIFKLNDMCNRSGLDTISTGSVIAFAMECYENSIITKADIDGIELTWGNSDAIITMTEKIIHREGFGDILADGVRIAALKIGKGAENIAMHIGGQEPGFQNATFSPGRATGFVADPTPGRHTAGSPLSRVDSNTSIGFYKELQYSGFEKYQYTGKGSAAATNSNYWQIGACAGLCLAPVLFSGFFPLLEFFHGVTGTELTIDEALKTGARIQTMRQLFNVREGIKPSDVRLPNRMTGIPPQSSGPLEGVTIDIDTLTREYREAMGWNPETGEPTEVRLVELGLQEMVQLYM